MTSSQVLKQLKFDDTDPELIEQIEGLIKAAREWCETYQNRAYITQTFELALDCWPRGNRVKLPRPQLQEIEYLTYRNGGVLNTWDASNYVSDDFSEPGYLIKVSGVNWPASVKNPNGIIIRYVAGYGPSPEDVPETIKLAIQMLTVYWFENGLCEPPCAVYNLLDSDRVVPI